MKAGTSFTRAYNMGSWSGAVCVASRHILNTGRFIWDAEIASKNAEQERSAGRWWSEYMKKRLYHLHDGEMACAGGCRKMLRCSLKSSGRNANQTPGGIIVHCANQPDMDPFDPKFEGFGREKNTGASCCG